MPYYQSRRQHRREEVTENERTLDRLGFWYTGSVTDPETRPGTIMGRSETVETLPFAPHQIQHRCRETFQDLVEGNFTGPLAMLQAEKLLTCYRCNTQQWVAIDTRWVSYPNDSLLHQPYVPLERRIAHPAHLDPNSQWVASNIELLKGLVTLCPKHAGERDQLDAAALAAIESAIAARDPTASQER